MTVILTVLVMFVVAGLLGYVTAELILNKYKVAAAIVTIAYLVVGLGLVIYALA